MIRNNNNNNKNKTTKKRRPWLRLPRLARRPASSTTNKKRAVASPVSVVDDDDSSSFFGQTYYYTENHAATDNTPQYSVGTTSPVAASPTDSFHDILPLENEYFYDDLSLENHLSQEDLVQPLCPVLEANMEDSGTKEVARSSPSPKVSVLTSDMESKENAIPSNTIQTTKTPFQVLKPSNGSTIKYSVPAPVAATLTEADFTTGQAVVVVSKQAGSAKMGRISKRVRKGTFQIRLDTGGTVNKRWTSLRPMSKASLYDKNNHDGSDVPMIATTSPSSPQVQLELKNKSPSWARQDDFCDGQEVIITTKDYSGQVGIIVGRIKKGTYKVEVEGGGGTTNKRWTSLQHHVSNMSRMTSDNNKVMSTASKSPTDGIVEESRLKNSDNTSTHETRDSLLVPSPVNIRESSIRGHAQMSTGDTASETTVSVGATVRIVGGSCKNEIGRIVGLKGKKTFVVELSGGDTVNKRANSIQPIGGDTLSSSSASTAGEAWRVEDADRGGTRFGSRVIEKIRFRNDKKAPKDRCFLNHILGERFLLIEEPLDGRGDNEPFATQVEECGCTYELVSAKVQSDTDAQAGAYHASKCVHLTYAKARGPRLETLDMKSMLLKIADFGSLNPRKVMARLELLQSPAFSFPGTKETGMFFQKPSDFNYIPDKGYVGCGFVEEGFLMNLAKSRGMGQTAASRLLGIQVRLFLPSMGIFKGMLCRKRIASGPPVQLCDSMLKVGPSKYPDLAEQACLLVTKNGFHSNSKINGYISQMLDPEAKDPPKKSFTHAIKPLSDMILRLWRGSGVPKEVCDLYAKKSVKPLHLSHAWIVGLADPTGLLPDGHVFVTGLKGLRATQEDIFVTRSPCVKPSDGKVLPCVTSKPIDMSDDEWEWLNPKEAMASMPERIADGDLDGDLYFVCWNDQILQHIQKVPMEDIPAENDPSSMDENLGWFEDAQKLMTNSSAVQEMSTLTGKLYTASNKVADESALFNNDPDAIAFGNAYKQALEFGKHGGTITLPAHLHKKLPPRLRKLVAAPQSEG